VQFVGKAQIMYEELVIAWNSGRILNQWDKFTVEVGGLSR
jgi:hypothetical protein